MPRHTHLMRRGSRYYLNVKVPKDLRAAYGKELIRKSLDTSDPHEAARLVRFESFRQDSEFEAKRRELRAARREAQPTAPPKISPREAYEIVREFFVELEQLSEEWAERDLPEMTPNQRRETLADLRTDATATLGGNDSYFADDGTHDLENFLRKKGWKLTSESPAYGKLCVLFRRARRENLIRTIHRVSNRAVTPQDTLFRDVFAHTPAQPARPIVTLGEMLNRFARALRDAKRTEGTQRTYEIPARILREVLGENTSLDAITKEDVERLFGLLRRCPANAAKRYKRLTVEQAIAAADKCGDAHRLAPKTLANYFDNISAIFNFAVEKRLMLENPAKDKWLRAAFESDSEETPKAVFTTDELNKLFRAPLYTGCRDDENGYATPGPNHPRRGRFWLPIISLFHGLRLNEVAQLYTEDVCDAESIPYFEIREERADGSKCDKRLKTSQSKRRVPLHPEIIRLGFLDYVAERRRDSSHPRLFPDLPLGASGYFSNPFSKWFRRFVTATLGEQCEATFHSFRHLFRDALAEAGVPIPDVEALGGWELIARSAERNYGSGPSVRRLREQIEKVKFPGLDISHLHPVSKSPGCRVRRRNGPIRA